METVAITCIGAMMTILSTYIWAQTKRPSFSIPTVEENTVDEPVNQAKTLRIKTTVMPDGRRIEGEENLSGGENG
jgi:hypothetical protein